MKRIAYDSVVVTVLNGMAQVASFGLFVVIATLFGPNGSRALARTGPARRTILNIFGRTISCTIAWPADDRSGP